MANYKRPTCRGSYALGSACGHCERCDDEKAGKFNKILDDSKCPVCSSTHIEGEHVYPEGDCTAFQNEYCHECNSEWQNIYALKEQLVTNNQKEREHVDA